MDSSNNSLPGEGEPPVSVSLRILSPSFESNQRISLDDLPLSTTIHDVKTHLTSLVQSHPPPEQQRLIYRGKPLMNPKATLETFLELPFDSVHTLHLVLPPTPEAAVGNGFAATDSTLRYRNIPAQTPSPVFQNQAGPRRDQAFFATGVQPLRENGAVPQQPPTSRPPEHSPHYTRLQEALNRIEQIQPQTEALNQTAERARSVLNAHATRMRYLNANNAPNPDSNNQLPQQPAPTPAPTANLPGSLVPPTNTQQQAWNNVAPQHLLLARIASQIIGLELDIQRGTAPPLDAIARARASLHAMLDARYRQPSIAISSEAENLLLRLQNVFMRGYQIRQIEHLRQLAPVTASYPGGPTMAAQTSGLYMVTGPSGEQMIISAPNTPQNPPLNIPTFPMFPDAAQPPVNDPLAAAVAADGAMQNIVRQAVLNQRDAAGAAAAAPGNENRNNNGNENGHVAQNIRRFWLFLRLYFFCFLFTDSGTWERFYFVLGAFIISFFSESPILRRVFEMVVEPVQRHLEGLIHGHPPVPAQQDNTNTNNNIPEQRPAAAGGADQGLRRIERAFALFIASLIPGVGERQVEVRNAAEEAARNAQEQQAREAEERAHEEAQNRDNANGQ